jgi:hypothetical protein
VTAWLPVVVGVALVAWLALDAALIALRGWRGRGRLRFADRWDALSRALHLAATALLLLVFVQWGHLPGALWWLVVLPVAAALSGAALRWPELPRHGEDGAAGTRRASAAGGAVLLVLGLALVVLV